MKGIDRNRSLILILIFVLTGLLLFCLNVSLTMSRLNKTMMSNLAKTENNIEAVTTGYENFYNNYRLLHRHIARLCGYYLESLQEPFSEESVKKAEDVLDAEAVYIIDPKGTLLFSSNDTNMPEFTSDKCAPLLDVSPDQTTSEPVTLKFENNKEDDDDKDDEENLAGLLHDNNNKKKQKKDKQIEEAAEVPFVVSCCYSYYLDSGHIVVVKSAYSDFLNTAEGLLNYYDVLERTWFTKGSLCFFISNDGQAYIRVDPKSDIWDEEFVQFPAKTLRNGYRGLVTINHKKYYSWVKKLSDGSAFLAFAMPVKELTFMMILINLSTVGIAMISLFLLYEYTAYLTSEAAEENNPAAARKRFVRKLSVLLFLCIFATEVISIYSHTLYAYASTVSSNVLKTEGLKETTASLDQIQAYGSEHYQKVVRIITRTAVAMISENDQFKDPTKLRELTKNLGAEHILIYNNAGIVTLSDLNYNGLTLSKDPKDLSSAFWWVIRGEPLLIQDKVDDSYLSSPYLFSGMPLKDKKGNYTGMVQLALPPSFRDDLVASTGLSSILSSYVESNRQAALAVDMDSEIVTSSNPEYNGLGAEDLGLTKGELKDEYTGYFTIQNKDLLGACQAGGKYWAIVASSINHLPLYGIVTGFISALPDLVAECLLFLIILACTKVGNTAPAQWRSFFTNAQEGEAGAEKRILGLIRYVSLITAGCIFIAVSVGSFLFQKGTAGYYIFAYPWSKGLNLFTLTRCMTYLFSAAFVMFVLFNVLSLLAILLPSRQETVIRLIISSAKYIAGLGALIFAMTLLGVPTTSLLASAGAVAVVFTVGAQATVSDILAGLFIIFEGSFKVGDMITVDDWHGQVVEIGIRNTKIHDIRNSDIKIMNNSTIKRVTNFSVYPSYCKIPIGIEYGMDIRELEAIIRRETPVIRKNLANLADDFTYLGVDEFADSAILLIFQISCRNQNYDPAKRALNREVKMMFERNNINVPFPQLVIHKGK